MAQSIIWHSIKWESTDQRDEFREWCRETSSNIKSLFTRKELVVFYLHYGLGYGCVEIYRMTGLTRHYFRKVVRLFKDYAKNADILYSQEMNTKELFYHNLPISKKPIKKPIKKNN